MPETPEYEVTVVGGGPAGLTTALYTTRLGHDTAMINRGGGRAAMMLDTHNVIGVPEETSGNEFLQTAREQIEAYVPITSIAYTDGLTIPFSGYSENIVVQTEEGWEGYAMDGLNWVLHQWLDG